MSYAIIALGGKQYRVREGQRLLVNRLSDEEGATLTPTVLLVGGDGETQLSPDDVVVTARVVRHVLGDKIRIGKYKRRKGYRRHAGFRAHLSQIEIAEIGGKAPERRAAKRREQPARAEKRPAVTPEEQPAGVPEGYESLTVARIADEALGWPQPMLEAALSYERDHAARKGALRALEAALAAKEEQA
jgi:large subunit ribosomal protein L21